MRKCLIPLPYQILLILSPILSVGSSLIFRLMLNLRDPEMLGFDEPNTGIVMTSTLAWNTRTDETIPL